MLGLEKLVGGGETTNSLTMNAPHADSLLDAGVQEVIGKPLARVDGPLKVAGQATYAAEYELDGLAYGFLVGSTVGKGRITELHAEVARAVPGVIDVITDYKTFLRNSQQAFEAAADALVDGAQGHGSNDFKIPLARRTLIATLRELTGE